MISKLRFYASGLILSACAVSMSAQYAESVEAPTTKGFYIGVSGGANWSSLRFSDLDKALYPDNNNNFSGVFSFFCQYNFGKDGMFGVRPEFAFLTRGGRLNNIGKGLESFYEEYYYHEPDDEVWLDDFVYRLKATYFDIRVPLIYTLGKDSWKVRPYVYVAPILSFAQGGYVDARMEYNDHQYEGVRYDLSKSNYKSLMFAGAIGLGANYYFNISGSRFFLGLEANYQHGFTDTYSDKEKDGKVPVVTQLLPDRSTKAEGTRMLSSWELKATLGIPLSVFSSKKPHEVFAEPEPEPVIEPVVVEEKKEVETGYELKPCYSLEEVLGMLDNGMPIEGKRICSIEDVQFDLNKSVIKPRSFKYLDKLADLLKRSGAKVKVMGHTDNTGTVERNAELSRERANAVVEYLKRQGVPSNRITSASYGSSRPCATNDTEAGRRLNRRVEFDIE